MKNFLSCFLFCSYMLGLSAQENTNLQDFKAGIRELEENYAGFPSLNTYDRHEYDSLKQCLLLEVTASEKKGYEAVGEIFGWFNDFHLKCGIYSEANMKRKAPDYSAEMEYNPAFLCRKIDNTTFLIRFPSCEGGESVKAWADNSVEEYRNSGCRNLIIDIRGNGGGTDYAYYPYLSLVYNREGMQDGVEIRNSADHLSYIKELEKSMPELKELVRLMEVSDDKFVPVNAGVSSIKQDTVFSLPEKVALIIDGNVGSSGEQMILDMRACSTRTVVYGKDNTLGCLDYSNTRRVDLPNSKISMYIPMTRSCRLPDKGIDKTGIAPDVRLDLPYPKKLTDNVDEWVRWVAKDLLKR